MAMVLDVSSKTFASDVVRFLSAWASQALVPNDPQAAIDASLLEPLERSFPLPPVWTNLVLPHLPWAFETSTRDRFANR